MSARRALDNRIGAVMPALLGLVPIDDEVGHARDDLTHTVERLLDVAHAEGALRQDVAFGDIGPMLIRLSRPLPGHVPAELDTALAHRQLDVLIDGLRAQPGRANGSLPGRALSLEAAQRLEIFD